MTEDIVFAIKQNHRRRRFAMKIQQKLDRSLESFIRVNATDWSPEADEKVRKKANARVKEIIEQAHELEPADPIARDMRNVVFVTDAARLPADDMRRAHERHMEKLAKQLPVWPWVESIDGVGALGLATIIAETGDLSKYANPAKVWKRLGFAPYQGFAGSTYKRDSWRPRALTSDEWKQNPFSGERYALLYVTATWLVNRQVEGADKSGTKYGRPKGPYGEFYVKRREHTAQTHPDWTDGHARSDALRVTMKKFLLDLWAEWRAATNEMKPKGQLPPDNSEEANTRMEPIQSVSTSEATDQSSLEAQRWNVRRQPIPVAA